MDTARLYADLRVAEGVKPCAYKDTLGNWTACVGHLLPPQPGGWEGHQFSDGQCQAWLQSDTAAALAKAQRFMEWASLDTDARQNAVWELVFNMGDRWASFQHARTAIYNKDWQTAHDQLLDSVWATQVGPTRSQRIARYILTGEFDCPSTQVSAAS